VSDESTGGWFRARSRPCQCINWWSRTLTRGVWFGRISRCAGCDAVDRVGDTVSPELSRKTGQCRFTRSDFADVLSSVGVPVEIELTRRYLYQFRCLLAANIEFDFRKLAASPASYGCEDLNPVCAAFVQERIRRSPKIKVMIVGDPSRPDE
jgi:hypothetical protein